MLKKLIEKEISQEEWCMTSGKDSHQTCKCIFGKKIKLLFDVLSRVMAG